MEDLMIKLKILARAEKTLFKAEAHRWINQALLSLLAIVCVLVALIFLNVGLFFELTDADQSSRAAFILCGGNLLLALVPLWLRQQVKPGPEEAMVEEIREMTLTEINRDVEQVTANFTVLGSSIRAFGSGGSPFSAGGLAALTPLLGFVIDFLKKHKS